MKRRARKKALRQIIDLNQENSIPLTYKQLADKIGVSVGTAYKYKKLLVDKGIIDKIDGETFPDGLVTYDSFKEIDEIAKFIEKCELERVNFSLYVHPLFTICRVSHAEPYELVRSLESAEKVFNKFESEWEKLHPNKMVVRYRKAMRKILQANNIIIPKNNRVFPSTNESNGDYAKVALTDAEFLEGLKFIESELGIEYSQLFGVQHEIFARPATMFKWIPNITFEHVDVDNKPYEFGTCSVFEGKTNKRYDKLILHPETMKICKEIKPNRPLIKDTPTEAEPKYANTLRKFYAVCEKFDPDIKYEKGQEGWLYQNRPIYTIRHSAAWMWMRRTGFNAGLVKTMGWESQDVLTKYYARITATQLMQQGICYYCRPPTMKTDSAVFCSPTHALAYYNVGERK